MTDEVKPHGSVPHLVCEYCREPYQPKKWYPSLVGKRKYCGVPCSVLARAASLEVKAKIRNAAQGRRHSEDTKKKMSQSRHGKRPTDATREKLRSLWDDPAYRSARSGENHPFWKVDRTDRAIRRQVKFAAYGMLRRSLASLGEKKAAHTSDLLGYSPEELREHLEAKWLSGMGWDNYGKRGWVIDHIRPLNSFPLGSSVAIMNALSNLQPLWADDNLRKGHRWDDLTLEGEA